MTKSIPIAKNDLDANDVVPAGTDPAVVEAHAALEKAEMQIRTQ